MRERPDVHTESAVEAAGVDRPAGDDDRRQPDAAPDHDRGRPDRRSGTATDRGAGRPSRRPGDGPSTSSGDSLFPELGTADLDVQSYDVRLSYDPETEELAGTVDITTT